MSLKRTSHLCALRHMVLKVKHKRKRNRMEKETRKLRHKFLML